MESEHFSAAIRLLETGDTTGLKDLLRNHSELATETDDGNASLLIRLIDWPGNRPNASDSAIALLEAGAEVDSRRDNENGTPLSGALCTEEDDVIRVLLKAGANIHAPCGWQSGSVLQQADELCENFRRLDDPKIKSIASLFSKAADRPVPLRIPVGGPIPLLFVSDFEAGLRFYTEMLGFRLVWRDDSDPNDPYSSIVRGATEFHLTVCKCENNVHVGRLYTRIPATDVDTLHAEFREAQIGKMTVPKDQPWGMREFEIIDSDGNRFVFFQF